MLNWLKSILGINAPAPVETPVAEAPKVEQAKTVAKPKTQAKKPAAKEKKSTSKTCDFDKLNKTQLLAEAKHRGVKANASLSKAEILERLKSA